MMCKEGLGILVAAIFVLSGCRDSTSDAGSCGNGIVEEGETCDGDCPTFCDDADSCTQDRLIGDVDACTAQCIHTTIDVCEDGDGCCPDGCDADSDNDCQSADGPRLLFKSGFEDDVYIDETAYEDNEDYRYIRGTDQETHFTWPIDILGASDSALHYIDDDNHQAVFSEIQTVIGHDGTSTKALYSEENYDVSVTQNPYEILNITEGTKDLYIRYWMKIDTESLTQKDKWRALFEYKTKDYASGDGYRLIAFIYTDEEGNPYWHWQGDADPQNPVWEIDNTTIPVPQDEWFLTEYYWHWSEGSDGRSLWKINGEVVGDHRGPTTRNSKPIDFIILTQIYGDANPKYQWVDDIEIWDGIPDE